MRVIQVLSPVLFIALSCGGAETDGGAATGGRGTGGQGAATGGVSASGGSSGGASSGGVATSGGTSTGGTSNATGGTATGAAGGASPGALVDCDLRKVTCRVATPTCAMGQVPSVSGSCYGPCTAIASCACTTAAECPDNDQYTCWSRTHCGPYVD